MSATELKQTKHTGTHTNTHLNKHQQQQQQEQPQSSPKQSTTVTTVNNTVKPSCSNTQQQQITQAQKQLHLLNDRVQALEMAMGQLGVDVADTNGKAKNSNNQQKIKPNASRRAAGANWKVLHENASGGGNGTALPASATNGVKPQKQKTQQQKSETNDVATPQQQQQQQQQTAAEGAVAANKPGTTTGLSKSARMRQKRKNRFLAIDCEMVGTGLNGQDDMLARVSIVNKVGTVLMDKYVKPRELVTDYRTSVSGIRPHNITNGEDFDKVQQEVVDLLQGKILVGHAIRNDLAVLHIQHPFDRMRDTSRYKPLCRLVSNGRTPSLKKLAKIILGIDIQTGEHSSVEDARAAMCIYNKLSSEWEEHHQKQQQKKHRH